MADIRFVSEDKIIIGKADEELYFKVKENYKNEKTEIFFYKDKKEIRIFIKGESGMEKSVFSQNLADQILQMI